MRKQCVKVFFYVSFYSSVIRGVCVNLYVLVACENVRGARAQAVRPVSFRYFSGVSKKKICRALGRGFMIPCIWG